MWWVGVVLVLLFSAGRGFITRNNFQNRCSKLQLSYEDIYSDEISDILVNYLAKDLSTGGVGTLDSTELIENAHILTKGRFYESCMEELLNECTTTQEKKAAERVDAFMRGFIVSERRSRARLKLNYLLAGASSNRFEEAVHLLLESDEVDEDLIQHIDSLIRKELLRSLGPAAEAKEEEQLEGVGKTSIEILRMVRRRLQVEGAVGGGANDGGSQTDVKLLAHLVSINDPLRRDEVVRTELTSVEKLESFRDFLVSGIEFTLGSSGSNSRTGKEDAEYRSGRRLQELKDVLASVETVLRRLKTGLKDDTQIFSTDAEDYLPDDGTGR